MRRCDPWVLRIGHPYPPEFRRRALDLVESGRTVRDVAASLRIAESCLHRWRHRDLVDRGLKPGTTGQESAELAAARARIGDLEEEVKILRKAAAAVEAVVRPKDRYRLVAELHAEGVWTGRACHALGVSRSGYYAWAGRAPSPRIRLLALVPEDGSAIGNTALMRTLGWGQHRYWYARDSLLEAGTIACAASPVHPVEGG